MLTRRAACALLASLVCAPAPAADLPRHRKETCDMPLPEACFNFDPDLLPGCWLYAEAYTQFADGTVGYNFTPNPAGRFVIVREPQIYLHGVMSPDLALIASGKLKVLTDAEAQMIATNQLTHYGSWAADPAAGTLTVQIVKSTFPNFDGITQVRTVTKLTETELEYVNHQVTNGGDAVVVARLTRETPVGHHHR